jgi:hypothetical protein
MPTTTNSTGPSSNKAAIVFRVSEVSSPACRRSLLQCNAQASDGSKMASIPCSGLLPIVISAARTSKSNDAAARIRADKLGPAPRGQSKAITHGKPAINATWTVTTWDGVQPALTHQEPRQA